MAESDNQPPPPTRPAWSVDVDPDPVSPAPDAGPLPSRVAVPSDRVPDWVAQHEVVPRAAANSTDVHTMLMPPGDPMPPTDAAAPRGDADWANRPAASGWQQPKAPAEVAKDPVAEAKAPEAEVAEVPDEPVPDDAVPDDATPDDATPDEPAPNEPAPNEPGPDDEVLAEAAEPAPEETEPPTPGPPSAVEAAEAPAPTPAPSEPAPPAADNGAGTAHRPVAPAPRAPVSPPYVAQQPAPGYPPPYPHPPAHRPPAHHPPAHHPAAHHPAAQSQSPAQPPGGPPGSAAQLTSSALVRQRTDVPTHGWRKVLHAVTGGAVNPGLSRAEHELNSLLGRVRTQVRGCHRIAVVSLKGGIGKTTTTACLGLMLAQYRGDRVVAIDANPDAGTLAERLTGDVEISVRDLLDNLRDITTFTEVSAYTTLADRLQVLASDQEPEVSLEFDEARYREVCGLLARFYNVVLTDSGTGLLHSAMAGTLAMADSLVVVSAPSVDGASRAAKTLDWLVAHGYHDLVARCVAVIQSVRPNAGRNDGGVDMTVLRNHFAARCRAVLEIPYDPHLVTGGLIRIDQLKPATRRAYLELAAAVGDGFALR